MGSSAAAWRISIAERSDQANPGRETRIGVPGRPTSGRIPVGFGLSCTRGSAYPVPRMTGGDDTGSAGPGLARAFMANRASLLRYLRARGAGDDAEDLVQEIWFRLQGGQDGVRIADPAPYLYRMAHNLMLDRVRAAQRRRRREQAFYEGGSEADDAPAIERTLLAREQLGRIEQALAALGERTDRIFRRFRVEGAAQRDIADEMGISLSAVEKHLQKAYRAIASTQAELQREDRDIRSGGSGDGRR
jgi:RNA polymerase sigma-70 factor (ECF subfamily)